MVTHFISEQTPPPPHARPLNLLRRAHHPIDNLTALRAAAQLAVEVELTTIPPYLTALYSISDRSSPAYQAVRSVVMEEMFHVNQAANLLIGVGGKPVFTGSAVPTYPTYLPSSNKERTPYIGLYRASPGVFRTVFMGIETPAPFAAPAEGKTYDTIAQLYHALLDGIVACVERYGASTVFTEAPGARQRTDIYVGKFGGDPLRVSSLDTAREAINQIIRQGEGAVDPDGVLVASQPYGAYHYYGDRTDGTYGPILGKPLEPSHYVKFLRAAEGPFPPTYPIVSNPRIADFTNEQARDWAVTFNKAYSLMLHTLERSFSTEGADPDFQLTLPLMHQQLATLANNLMTTPTRTDGDPGVGPNAAPTFEYDPQSSFADVISSLRAAVAPAPRTAFAARALIAAAAPADAATGAGAALIRDFEALQQRATAAGIQL